MRGNNFYTDQICYILTCCISYQTITGLTISILLTFVVHFDLLLYRHVTNLASSLVAKRRHLRLHLSRPPTLTPLPPPPPGRGAAGHHLREPEEGSRRAGARPGETRLQRGHAARRKGPGTARVRARESQGTARRVEGDWFCVILWC